MLNAMQMSSAAAKPVSMLLAVSFHCKDLIFRKRMSSLVVPNPWLSR